MQPSPCSEERNSETDLPLVAQQTETKLNIGNHEVPEHIEDYDKENRDDIFQVSEYAMDILNYLKDREVSDQIYIKKH